MARAKSTFPREHSESSLRRWNSRGPLLLIALVTLFTFSRAFTSEFVMWDDDMVIYRNSTLTPPTLHSLKIWWTTPDIRMWNPLTETMRGVLALCTTSTVDPVTHSRLNPYVFHANDVILHTLTTLIVYQVLRLLGFRNWPACAGALLFGMHPVQVEPVAWVTALKDILCGFLSVSALWALLRANGFRVDDDAPFELRTEPPGTDRHYFAMATVLFALATLSKPTGAILPLLALPLMWLRWKTPPKGVWMQMGLWVVLGVPILILTKILQSGQTLLHVDYWQRPFVAADTLAFYLYKLIWPVNLAIDYGRRPVVIFHNGSAYWTWLLPAAAVALLIFYRKSARVLVIGALVFLAPLSPVLGLVQFDFQGLSSVADRYLYLSLLGVAICFAWIVERSGRRGLVAAGLLLALFSGKSWYQTGYWHDSMTLLSHALEVNPLSPVALNNIAFCYDYTGDIQTEIQYLQRAIASRPDLISPYLSLGEAEIKLGHWEKAKGTFRAGYAVAPQQVADELISSAADYGRLHKNDLAIWYGRLAVELRPNSAVAHRGLGAALAEMGDRDAALAELRLAAQIDPSTVGK